MFVADYRKGVQFDIEPSILELTYEASSSHGLDPRLYDGMVEENMKIVKDTRREKINSNGLSPLKLSRQLLSFKDCSI